MATSPSLFGGSMSPQEMQSQLLNQRAAQFAQFTPDQQLGMMAYKAGSGLGTGLAGAFGVDVQDPTIKRATKLRELASQYNTNTAAGLRQMADALRATDPDMALQLSQKAAAMDLESAKLSSEQALAAQRSREKEAADPFQKLIESGKYTPSSVKKYKDSGNPADLVIYEKPAVDSFQKLLEVGKYTTPSLKKYKQSGDVGDLEFKDSDAKTQVVDTVDGQLLINSETGSIIANIGKKPTKPSIGSDIAAGLSPIMGAIAKGQATKSGESSGTAVGKDVAAIQGKYTALSSIDDALNVVKKGIYAGGYGPLEEALAKYSKGTLADKQRLINTEEFRSYIGDVVIPRLTEFGGNDSVEELKYLKSVMAGETTMESKSIERILNRAKEKIQAGVKRIEAQQKAIEQGKPLPTGPMGKKTVTKTTRSGLVYEVVEEE